jgi:tetratricopeptide (TPR) repeat protein
MQFSTDTKEGFTPFWHRLPRFFLYPLSVGALMRMAGYSLFGGLAMFIPPMFGALLSLILWIVFLKYAFVVMERTAGGQFDEPNDVDGQDGDAAQVIRQFVLFLVFGILFAALGYLLGIPGFVIGAILINVLPPAGIMIIAVTRSLLEALNPFRIYFFIRTIGTPYLALCFILISLTSSGAWLKGFMYSHIHSWLALPVLSFVEFYFALMTYHMMGYVIYQYHDELGLDAKVGFAEAEAKLSPNKAADPVLVELTSLVSNGQEEKAIDLLERELRVRWEDNDLHERYQKLLVATGKLKLALHHGREFIVKLVNEKRMFQALDLCEECLNIDREFQLQDSYQVYDLAVVAEMSRRRDLALKLMRRFDSRYPEHPHIPAIYLLSAQILNEHFHMHEEAKQILHTLKTRFPEHTLAMEAGKYLEVVSKCAAIG